MSNTANVARVVAQESGLNWLSRARAWVSIGLLTPAGLCAVFSRPHAGIATWGEFACDAIGWVLFFFGATFRWWATLYIGGRKTGQLIDSGAYSVTRNPIYLGTFLMTLSVGILIQSVTFLVSLAFVGAFYLAVTIRVEELRLRNIYGVVFDEYCHRVPRFFPNFRLYHSPATVDVRLEGVYSELIRSTRWVWIPLICHLVTHLRAQAWWPNWFNAW